MSSGGNGDDLNLTPFLDLFSTLICFLLLTAVWFQVEALSTNVDNVSSSDSPPPPDQPKKVQLAVTILKNEIQMNEDEKATKLPLELDEKGNIRPDRLKQVLADWRQKYPDRKDVILNTENQIPYKYMITTFDTLVGEGWPDVGVNTQ